MSESYELPLGISITTQCQTCLISGEQCPDCEALAEARLSERAHELVDEGNLQYQRPWFINHEPVSNHDWISPLTRGTIWNPNEIREEFTEPTVHLQDGGSLDNISDIEDYLRSNRDTECIWCHIMTPKMYNDCQSCDQPLEVNVR